MQSPLSGLAPARRRLAVVLIATLAVAVVVGIAAVTVLRLADGGEADQAQPGPVLLVPGYGGTVDDLAALADELRRSGREVAVFEPSEGAVGDLRVQARRLRALVEKTLDRTGEESVDLVGYSAGGVLVRLYVADEGGASVVRRVLTLGSPHHGTEVAALAAQVAGGCPTACEQLATGSDLLRRLNAGDETPAGPLWITVRTAVDRIVTPSESAALDGALNLEVQELCPGAATSHGDLPGAPVVLAVAESVLGTAAPRVPQDITC